jgi:hypothetical protein
MRGVGGGERGRRGGGGIFVELVPDFLGKKRYLVGGGLGLVEKAGALAEWERSSRCLRVKFAGNVCEKSL